MRIHIIIPSLASEAPVKGAIALANILVTSYPVSLICLKAPIDLDESIILNDNVEVLQLANVQSWCTKLKKAKELFKSYGGHKNNTIISFCLSADVFSYFLKRHAMLISSVRGNLPSNYRISYGRLGFLLARFQFFILKRYDYVIAMSENMKEQLIKYGLKRVYVIGNFIDEIFLQRKRIKKSEPNVGNARFIYIGRLVPLKKPVLLLDIIKKLRSNGIECHLDIVGDGPMYAELEKRIKEYKLCDLVEVHGHVNEPYELLQKSDCFVLPSISEGVSRAVLEALFFGIPCIVRDIDAANEIIEQGKNGELFENDNKLFEIMKRVVIDINSFRVKYAEKELLPKKFRQQENLKKYQALLNRT